MMRDIEGKKLGNYYGCFSDLSTLLSQYTYESKYSQELEDYHQLAEHNTVRFILRHFVILPIDGKLHCYWHPVSL